MNTPTKHNSEKPDHSSQISGKGFTTTDNPALETPTKNTATTSILALDPELQKIIDATHHNPFSVLGKHTVDSTEIVRVYIPQASQAFLPDLGTRLTRLEGTDFFQWRGAHNQVAQHYQIKWYDRNNQQHIRYDPYCFAPQIPDYDLHLFGEGKHWHAYRFLGAHLHSIDAIEGVLFATWAPNAKRVSVIGDFNDWDGRAHPMRTRGNSGVWELFIPGIKANQLYKFEIRGQHGNILQKADPYGQAFELRPNTASLVLDNLPFLWQDKAWIEQRKNNEWLHTPLSIYEVHLGSWQRNENDQFLNYTELAQRLVDHVKRLGFTHLQLLPITEHPFDASWGYQTTGYFAPTRRFGTPDEFRYFVNHCHRNGIGVILDWVPAHFPKDAHALAEYDGTALYEHEDPRRGEHRDWGTLIYNYGRNEVKNFLLSSALYWLEEYHIDGLRVDAVASMLYLDYSRNEGDWLPNPHGGNENLEAIDFLREMNTVVHGEFPGCMTIAEESTSWPQVTRPTWLGGLGFSMKWNMGWMHDTLNYFNNDPIYRQYHHDQLTFGLMYSFSENFVLPFSHDEVVHGKSAMLNKMPGDEWQKFANLRLLYTYMYTYPGKKTLFMGAEFAQSSEWNVDQALDWHLLQYPLHQGVQKLVTDLNTLYKELPALHQLDFEQSGFEWIDCHDAAQSVLSFQRKSTDSVVIVALNFTPMPREDYRIGVPYGGTYRELLNSDSTYYGGSNIGNASTITAQPQPWMGLPYSVNLTLPPLGGVVIKTDHHS
ncbi:MAG: 1,4-alpha-glucan branching protein GlgB [Gammaproteobacteria bacterium]|nr:1,4-alpha-glucan branching protein GlgB [Gammaproteobacteria bacterium]